jgi:uroporphyrin-3 C-methyltransferase
MMTEKKTPLVEEKAKATETKASTDKVSEKKASPKKASTKPKASPAKAEPQKTSKLAIAAIIIALVAPASHYFWQTHQSQILSQTIQNDIYQKNAATLAQAKKQIQQNITQQGVALNKQLQQVKEQTASLSEAKIEQLTQAVAQLEQRIQQRQPSDWLTHEAEYLIRVAARTLWLEHDTSAAIGLLNDADSRLAELNDPAFLSVRELIHQDIKSLELLPVLKTDEIILSLMAMGKQVEILPLAVEEIGKGQNSDKALELSDDINDWQANLTKTWQKFLNDFIRVRQRAGSIEPLIAPNQQANLKQNLSLKIQLALWAASERKGDIYQKALADIELWLNEFYAMNHPHNQQFMESLIKLKALDVSYDYPSELMSLTAIRVALTKQSTLPATSAVTEEVKEAEPVSNDTNEEGNL